MRGILKDLAVAAGFLGSAFVGAALGDLEIDRQLTGQITAVSSKDDGSAGNVVVRDNEGVARAFDVTHFSVPNDSVGVAAKVEFTESLYDYLQGKVHAKPVINVGRGTVPRRFTLNP